MITFLPVVPDIVGQVTMFAPAAAGARKSIRLGFLGVGVGVGFRHRGCFREQ